MRQPRTRIQVAELPRLADEMQRGFVSVHHEGSGHVGDAEMLATQVNLQLWHVVLQLHAILDADPDEGAHVLVKAGLLVRMDEMAGLRMAVEGKLS